MINIIVAVSENNVIGGDNKLLWHISEDLKRFKEITSGNTVIMGRKTYESIGKSLPNRENIIITRNKNYNAEKCVTVSSLDDAILKSDKRRKVFIIGGGEIYRQALQYTDNIYLTRVHQEFEGDTTFTFDEEKFKEVEEETIKRDGYTFITYRRLRNS